MPATVRGLYRPRRRLIKPRGTPKLIRSLAPRGLIFCCPFSDASFFNIAGSMPARPAYAGTNQLQSCPDGLGLKLDNSAQCLGFDGNSVTSSLANGWSLEALVRITSYVQIGQILGWNQNVDGTGGADRFLSVNFGSGPDFRSLFYDGANKIVEGFNFSAGQRCHVVATASSSLFSLYVNGALITTTGLSNAGLNNYRYLCIGANFSADYGNGTLVLANFANVAWTATEVQARYLNPYGFLAWPEDRRHYLVGVAAGGATSYSFPTAGWVWNHQAPTLAFVSTSTQKSWAWNHQAPTLAFATAAAQKAWAWAKGAPSLGFASAATQKAWAWVGGAPILPRAIAAAQKAWRWAAASPTMTGGNFNPLAAVLRYLGPVWKRRRSRPPL